MLQSCPSEAGLVKILTSDELVTLLFTNIVFQTIQVGKTHNKSPQNSQQTPILKAMALNSVNRCGIWQMNDQ